MNLSLEQLQEAYHKSLSEIRALKKEVKTLQNKIPVEGSAIDTLRLSLERKIVNIAIQLDDIEDLDITDEKNEFLINLVKTWTKEGASFRKSLDYMESGKETTDRDEDFDLERELLR